MNACVTHVCVSINRHITTNTANFDDPTWAQAKLQQQLAAMRLPTQDVEYDIAAFAQGHILAPEHPSLTAFAQNEQAARRAMVAQMSLTLDFDAQLKTIRPAVFSYLDITMPPSMKATQPSPYDDLDDTICAIAQKAISASMTAWQAQLHALPNTPPTVRQLLPLMLMEPILPVAGEAFAAADAAVADKSYRVLTQECNGEAQELLVCYMALHHYRVLATAYASWLMEPTPNPESKVDKPSAETIASTREFTLLTKTQDVLLAGGWYRLCADVNAKAKDFLRRVTPAMQEFRKKQINEHRNPAWLHGEQMRKVLEAFAWQFKLSSPLKRDLMGCLVCGNEHYGWRTSDHPALYHKTGCKALKNGDQRVIEYNARYARVGRVRSQQPQQQQPYGTVAIAAHAAAAVAPTTLALSR